MKTETKYESPEIEVIEVEVEKGFATSGGNDGGDAGGEAPDFPWVDPWAKYMK